MVWDVSGTKNASPEERTRFPRVLPMGLSGLLVQFADRLDDEANRAALAFQARLLDEALAGVVEIAPSLGGVFLRLDPLTADRGVIEARVRALLADGAAPPAAGTRGRLWRLPAVFGGAAGPDLADIAARIGCDVDEAVAELTARPLRVMALGFAPGLPYMGILPERWDIPRKAGLTPRVPVGGVVVAVRQAIIFPTDTPTGWWHVGQSRFRGFRPEAAAPFLLGPGDEVLLQPVTEADLDALHRDDPDGAGASVAPSADAPR
jgi:KipI family sensor histidine kinase inhibitor